MNEYVGDRPSIWKNKRISYERGYYIYAGRSAYNWNNISMCRYIPVLSTTLCKSSHSEHVLKQTFSHSKKRKNSIGAAVASISYRLNKQRVCT